MVSDLSKRIANLPPERLALFLERLGKTREAEPISRRAPDERCALSFTQEGFWFLDRMHAGSGVNTFRAVRLTGRLKVDAFERALDTVVIRHEVLRATFHEDMGRPYQVFDRGPRPRVVVISLESLSPDLRVPLARTLAVEAARLPFDLSVGPLLRAWLLRLRDEEHILLLTLHHIVSDGWSSGVFLRDLTSCYAMELGKRVPPLPDLPVQYADFAVWQRRELPGERLEELLRYWRERITDLPSLELPADRPRTAVPSSAGASVSFTLKRGMGERLEALSRRAGATPFVALVALLQVLLLRYSGQHDLVLGTPVAGRNSVDLEDLIGCFINTLILRLRGRAEGSFLALLQKAREVSVGALANQELPFAKLQEEVNANCNLQQTSLFQVMLVLQNTPAVEPELEGLRLTPFPIASGLVALDLQFEFAQAGENLTGRVEFRTDLFERETVRRWVGHLETLVEEVVRDPAQPVEGLPLLPAAERMQILREWNDTRRDYGRYRPVHLEIAERAKETPERTAVVFEGEHLTYGELERQVVGLARRLRTLGVGPEVRVAVEMERSVELVVATVAVLRSGGAYVPLDPSYPADRLAYMVEDAGAPVLLTQRRLLRDVRSGATQVLCVDDERHSSPPLSRVVDADAPLGAVADLGLVYVIYTSGSTGRPKGAMNMHRAVRNRLFWMQETYGLEATDRVLQKTPFSFDVSVWELFWPLIQGACMILARPGGHQDPNYLNDLIQREGVTTMHFVPSMLDIFLAYPGVEGCTSLRRVVCSGEALSQDLADRFQALIGCGLHNLYGPTEAAVDVTSAVCASEGRGSSVTIGRPIGNLEIYLLDHDLRVVPIGMPGELYIGGAGLGRGYLGKPDLTAERFVPDGMGVGMGARLYRTGDLARYLPDGRIQFLGRVDQQVKLRGFRIELGEIEATLRESPSVAEAVVVGRRATVGDLQLFAYLVPCGDSIPSADELSALLRRKLPSYMIPSAFVTLERLPLSPSGKLDHRALPSPEATPAAGGLPSEARTPTEEILAGLWAEVLRRPRVGPNDDFFALGGHSLLGSQLVARIRRAYGIEVPLPRIFEFPVLSKMAAMVDTLRDRGEAQSWFPALEPTPREGPLPLSFAQQRFWFAQQMDAGSGLYNLALAVCLEGGLDVDVLRRSLSELLRRHEVLRTKIQAVDGEPRQLILSPAPARVPIVDLSALADEAKLSVARRLAWEEADRPFDLAADLPLRLRLLRLQQDRHWALLTVHHVATDGWSMDILFDDFGTLYSAFLRGEPSPLPELQIQYADFAAWQRNFLQGELLTRYLAFWRDELEGMPHTLGLPTDRPQPARPTLRGGRAQLLLEPALYQAVQAFSRREGVTLFMFMLSALQVLLARISAQPDFAIGTLVAGRAQPETEGLIGALVNSLVLRTRLGGRPTGHDLLLRVRENWLSAFTYQQLPFDRLVEELQPTRDAYRTPFFQVVMLFQNFRSTEVKLPGLSLSSIDIGRQLSAFDLTLAIEQNGDDLGSVLEYRAELFDPTTAQRLLAHLTNFLAGLVERTGESAFDLPLLTPAEQQQIFREWNPVDIRPAGRGFLDFFATQVELRPDTLAVSGDGEQLSYAGLDRLSDRLACALVERGIGMESVVAVWMERTVEMASALLGVLKAGAAFLPLDPSYPQARLHYLLEDSGSRVLLARSLPVDLPHWGLTVLAPMEAMASVPMVPRLPFPAPEAAAYTIYTSGSTGRPKGVVVSHGPLASYALELIEQFQLVAEDRVLQFASPSFDVMIEEFFPAWAAGACVVLARPPVLTSPHELALSIEREQVTLAEVPTAYWHEWVRELVACEAAPPATLRRLLIGGEAAALAALGDWLPFRIPVSNVYGLTEVTVTSAVYDFDWDTTEPVPIGRPVGNTRLDVLDAGGRAVPVGIPGELHIAGEGLARGYLGRPDATAERFLPDPEAGEPGRRRYRTGDLVRYRSDGNLEFLGRIDEQVKIRGFRIELGEIEAALRAHPAVGDAVAAVREGPQGDRRLAVYLSPGAGFVMADTDRSGALLQSTTERLESVTQEGLRRFLAGILPEYMLPSTWMSLPALPRTPNGKVDRRNLPAPDLSPASTAATPSRVSLPIRDLVAAIWSEVLGPASARDLQEDFFTLGGHSLLAMKLFARLHGAFATHFPIALIFEAPTLGRLVERIEEELRRERDLELPPLARMERGEPQPASYAQQRLWYLEQLDPGHATYNVAVALRVEGELNLDAFAACVAEIVRRHEVLRTTFSVVDGAPVQVIQPPGEAKLPVVDLSGIPEPLRGSAADRLVGEDRNLGFDLEKGPLLRVRLLKLAGSQGILLFCAHHIVCDGWSVGVFVRELATLYRSILDRLPSNLPELPAQYADYSVWQRGWLSAAALERHLRYWQETLRPLPPPLNLPVDRDGQAAARPHGESRAIVLSQALSATMRKLGGEHGCSLFVLVTAAFQAFLASITEQTDFLLGTNVANRGLVQLESMIGFFVNQLPLRANLAFDPSFAELLRRVRASVLEAWAHQDVPFEMVVEAVRPDRGAGEIFQAKIDFDAVPEEPEIPGVRLQAIPVNRRLAHVDLLMIVEELDPEIGIALDYRVDRFLPTTIERWLSRFESLLRRVVENPEVRLSALTTALSEEEREKLASLEPVLAETSLQRLRSLRGRASRS